MSGFAPYSSLDEVEQLQLHFGADAAERGELDARLLAAEVAPRLAERADRPLQVAEHLPVENVAQPLRTDDQVADPEVAVDQYRRLGHGRALAQPAQAELEGRVGLVH